MKINLNKAKLIKRYKRFLADITLPDGSTTTIHVANTGAMSGCAEPGDIVWYSTSDNPKRKYPFSWEVTQKLNGEMICVNTLRANQLTEEAIKKNIITELIDHDELSREVKYGAENSKIDFLLTKEHSPDTYVEVKSVTLLENKDGQPQGYFPDAVSTRGQKHLRELIEMKEKGNRSVLLFSVLHSGIKSVKAASHVDPKYAALLKIAFEAGVEVFAYQANFTLSKGNLSIALTTPLPVII